MHAGPGRNIEVYREAQFAGYASSQTLRAGGKSSPFAFPELELDVTELLRLAK